MGYTVSKITFHLNFKFNSVSLFLFAKFGDFTNKTFTGSLINKRTTPT